MIELKGQQAIDYLGMVRSTIHPKDQFANLPILASMLDIERAYLQRFMDLKEKGLVNLTIDTTGFPELPSWQLDLRRAYAELEQIKVQRAKNLLPVIQQIFNASPAGVRQAGEYYSSGLTEGDELVNHLVRAKGYLASWVKGTDSLIYNSKQEKEKTKNANQATSVKDSPFFCSDPNFPGVLVTRLTERYGTYAHKEEKIGFRLVRSNDELCVSGFKYIGPFVTGSRENHSRLPTTLLFTIKNYYYIHEIASIIGGRILSPSSPLIDRSLCDSETGTHLIYKIDKPKNQSRARKGSKHEKEEVKTPQFEFDLADLNSPLSKLYSSIDATILSDSELNSFIASLPRLNSLVEDTGKFISENMNNLLLDSAQILSQTKGISQRLEMIFNSLPSDYLRREVQLALAEALSINHQRVMERASGTSVTSVSTNKSRGVGNLFARFRKNRS